MHKGVLWICLIVSGIFAGNQITDVDLKEVTWKYKGLQSGVHTYRQKDPDGKLVAVRGTTIIDAPLELVLTILVDGTYEKQKKWVPNLKEFTLIHKNTMYHRTLYVHVGLPWPVKDRDFSYTSEIAKTPKRKEVVIEYVSNDTLVPKKDKAIRGSMKTMFILTKISPNKTKIDLRAIADPRGAIPKFAINLAQRDYSEGMLCQIRRQVEVERGRTTIHPDFVDILSK